MSRCCASFLWSLRRFITAADKFVDSDLFLISQFDSRDKLAPTNDRAIFFIASFNQQGRFIVAGIKEGRSGADLIFAAKKKGGGLGLGLGLGFLR